LYKTVDESEEHRQCLEPHDIKVCHKFVQIGGIISKVWEVEFSGLG